jgi:hypothetical protein
MNTQTKAPVYDETVVGFLLGVSVTEATSPPPPVDGFVTFFDPGWSVLRLREAVADRGNIFYPHTWYDNEPFAKFQDPPRYRQLQMEAVKNSFGKTYVEQRALVPRDMEIPTARVVLMTVVIHFLATGERLFTDCCVRSFDQTAVGDFVFVGNFDRDGVDVGIDLPHDSARGLGVVLARKF